MKKNPNFIWKVKVYYEDTDAGQIVYYANYLKYLERARTEWLASKGLEHLALNENLGIAFVVSKCNLEFLRSAKLGDNLLVEIFIQKLGKVRVELLQNIRMNQDLVLTAEVKLAVVDYSSGKPKKLPTQIWDILNT